MFSLTYFPDDGLPWRISWNHTPMLYLEHGQDAAAMLANLTMGSHFAQPQTELEAARDMVNILEPTFLELCTGEIYVVRPTNEGDNHALAPVARPGR